MLAQGFGPAGAGFLAGLEDQAHPAVDLIPHGVQRLAGPDEHGGVSIVAAGVHDAGVLGTVGLILVPLLNGQSVHVPPDADGEARFSGVHGGDNGIAPVFFKFVGNADLVQLPPHKGGGAIQLPAQFGVHMQFPPDANQHLLIHRTVQGVDHGFFSPFSASASFWPNASPNRSASPRRVGTRR